MTPAPEHDAVPPTPMGTLEENVRAVRERMGEACRKAGRPPQDVDLVAVTKNRPASDIDALYELGIRTVGENRVQEALRKHPRVEAPVRWHMIGHLQKNKAGKVLELFSSLHSADSSALLAALDRRLESRNPEDPFPVYVQVNVSGEASKSGIEPSELDALLAEAGSLSRVRVVGLMTMPPWSADPEEARPHFARLARLASETAEKGLLPPNPGLSMGMTNDFEVAIEEGATVVRVGSAFFAPRP